MSLPDLSLALAALNAELSAHESEKQGAWERQTLLNLLTHGGSHNLQARLRIVNKHEHSLVIDGHDMDEHMKHQAVRAMMALQRWLETGVGGR